MGQRRDTVKVLLLDNWGEKAKRVLEGMVDLRDIYRTEPLFMGGAEVIIVSLDNKHGICLDMLPDLKFIASCTTGLDHIDTEYCKAKGIKVISLQGERDFLSDVWATAEHAWALIISLIRKVPFAHNDVCAGNWNREAWQGTELRGKTLGIVGYGRVGRQVSRFAEAFGMNQVIHDKRFEIDVCPSDAMFTGRIEDVLQNSDIITVHVPLNDETRGMFGAEQFATMKPGAYFINTSRAPIVEPQALYNALGGKIAGAAIDVMEGYPHKYWGYLIEYAKKHDNLIITPHIAGNTRESREKTQLFIAERIKQFIQGGG
jgi:D-3-phosphoglycerate dehydrogenase